MSDALADARDLPPGPDKVAELDAVVAAADRAGDVRLGFEARLDLIDACLDAAEPARVLGLFAWCRAAADREPLLFSDTELALLRYYHLWAVGTFRASPGVGRAEAEALLDDLERRFREDQRPLFAVHRMRAEMADHLGDLPAARQWLARCAAGLPRPRHRVVLRRRAGRRRFLPVLLPRRPGLPARGLGRVAGRGGRGRAGAAGRRQPAPSSRNGRWPR